MILQRLTTDNYVRPPVTFTESCTIEYIKNKLENYEKVENIQNVEIGKHIQYFSKCEDGYKYRTGGKLISKFGEYIVLSNGKKTWCVQIIDTEFYYKEIKRTVKQFIK